MKSSENVRFIQIENRRTGEIHIAPLDEAPAVHRDNYTHLFSSALAMAFFLLALTATFIAFT